MKTHTLPKIVVAAIILLHSAALVAQQSSPGKPTWTSANNQISNTGSFQLAWKAPSGPLIEIYRLTETFSGANRVAYVEGISLALFRSAPGVYTFKLAACVRDQLAVQSCGTDSSAIKVQVSEDIFAGALAEPQGGTVAQTNIVGGPDQLQPGLWSNPAKKGQGWSFYWANRLAQSQNPSNAYDLYGIWYTYEGKRLIAGIGPTDYRPVVATMKLVKEASTSNYIGSIYIKRGSTDHQVGNATVVFGANDEVATISWTASFKWQGSLSDSDSIQQLAGTESTLLNTDITNYAGLWGSTTASSYIIDDVGSFSEAIQVVFYDDNGDPTWIQAFRNDLDLVPPVRPVATDTSFCYYHIQGGYLPTNDQSTLPWTFYTGAAGVDCDPDNATASDRNGRRYFSDFEVGRYWVSFTLPPGTVGTNSVAGGSVNIGTSGTPATLAKAANFHRIQFNGSNSCQTSVAAPACTPTLTWFTDGAYPSASVFAYNTTTSARTLLATSTAPAMENQSVALSAAGVYRFELRMTTSSSSALIAQSANYTVTLGSATAFSESFEGSLTTQWTQNSQNGWAISTQRATVGTKSAEVDGPVTNAELTSIPINLQGTTQATINFSWLIESALDTNEYLAFYVSTDGGTNWTEKARLSGNVDTENVWAPAQVQLTGISSLRIRFRGQMSDDTEDANVDNVVVTIPIPNTPPVVTSPGAQTTVQNTAITPLVIQVTDAQSNPVTCSITGLPTGLSESSECTISGTVTAAPNTYSVTVTANDGTANSSPVSFNWTVTAPPVTVFTDSFEVGEWNSLWTEDTQNDWDRLSQRASAGTWSAEVDGAATDAKLISIPINLQGATQATISFKWLIESGVDTGEYIAFDTSTDGGTNWTQQRILRGDVDPEGAWRSELLTLSSISSLRLRFRGTVSASDEEANVDEVLVTTPAPANTPPVVTSPGAQTTVQNTTITPLVIQVTDAQSNPVTCSITGLPTGLSESSECTISGTVTAAPNTYSVTVTANDGTANSSPVSFNWTVTQSNTPPVVTSPGTQTTPQNTTITPLVIQVTDAQSNPVTCSITGLSTGLSESSECTISGTVTAAPNTYSVTVTANDGIVNSSPVSFNWIVTAGGVANPENPPAPATAPSMTVDAASSRVGATAGSFRVDESGNATYSIPILTAAGSGGMTPQISLSYNSQSGNGPLGVGWTLGGFSAITRCSQTIEQDGGSVVRGISLTASDRFCLDGQRLMAVSGTYGNPGTEYRTEIDSISKIISSGTAGTGPQSFTVYRKDGSVTTYGGTADSRIEARTATDIQTVLTWAENRVTDSAGNYMDYVYDELSGSYGDPVEFVLTKVSYTGNVKSPATLPYAELVFNYSSNRTDFSVSYVAGSQVVQTRLLTSIESKAKIDAGSAFQTLRYYETSYGSDGYNRNALDSIKECRDSSETYCFGPTVFGWLKRSDAITSSPTPEFTLPDVFYGLVFGDISGDGRPDLVYTEKSGSIYNLKLARANANGTFTAFGGSYPIPEVGTNNAVTVHVIDVNADGFQDVIYPETIASELSWQVRLGSATGLGSRIELESSSSANPAVVKVMDFDGDGLSDILYNQKVGTGQGSQLVLLRNAYTPGGAPHFLEGVPINAELASVAWPHLFPNDVPDDNPQNPDHWWINDEAPGFGAGASPRNARVFDYNGDGAVDLLVKVSMSYCQTECGFEPSGRTALTESSVFEVENLDPDPFAPPESELNSQLAGSTATVAYWVIYESDTVSDFVLKEVIARDDGCNLNEVCDDFSQLPIISSPQFIDINVDGLADLVYQNELGAWQFRLNKGGALEPATAMTGNLAVGLGPKSQVQDINGDGYPDLLYPSALGDPNATWKVHLNQLGLGFSGSSSTVAPVGDTTEKDLGLFADFSGDGKLDHLLLMFDGVGAFDESQIRLGGNTLNGGSTLPSPANVITSITNGFGAQTVISYLPLTDSSVYSRMIDGKNANWGGGSVVYDLIAPIYVVSEAASSAPVYNGATGMSSVQYHYVGAKLQGGGRGFLGFGEVITFDPQSNIRTNTRYRQDFPYVGLPGDTTQAHVSSSNEKFHTISNTAATTPKNWGAVTASTGPESMPSGTRLSYAINEWAAIATITGKAWFPHIAKSLERSYTLTGSFDRKVFTTNTYSAYGDLITADVKTYATDGTTEFATQATSNAYLPADTNKWWLGRLSATTVIHSRQNLQSGITRKSSFEYDIGPSGTGILTKEIIEPDVPSLTVTTTYTLDRFGNRTGATVSGSGFADRTTTNTYDPLGRFVVEAHNAYNQLTQQVISWDAFGNVLQVDNIDDVRTTAATDHMGRPFISYIETGAWSKTLHVSGAGSSCPGSGATAFYTTTTGGGQPTQVKCFDRVGREIRTATQGFNGTYIFVDRYYNESGRPEQVTEPYFSGGTQYWNFTAYDDLGRPKSVDSADGNQLDYAYDTAATACSVPGAARQVMITNSLGQVQLEIRNALGEIIAVRDNACGEVSYTHDAVGNVTSVIGADDAETTTKYDLAGRKIELDDPDKGLWKYAYNPLGELLRQLDSKNQAIDFYYDDMGRVTDRRELSGTTSLTRGNGTVIHRETTSWNNSTGNGKGQIVGSLYQENIAGATIQQKTYFYDTFGRLSEVSTSMDGLTLSESTSYDQFGRVFQQFDASGDDRGVRYHYNSQGYVEKLREAREGTAGIVYQQIVDMDARGHVREADLNGGAITAYAVYEPASGRLETLFAEQGLVTIEDVDYEFDVLGNLLSRHDLTPGNDSKESFVYDTLNRLEATILSINGAAATTTLSLQYDAAGNIENKSNVGDYLYGQGSAGPHAVTCAGGSTGCVGGITYTYDANGNNTSSSDGRSITYTEFDQAKRIQKGAEYTEFTYGLGNERIKRVDSNNIDQARTTWYFGSVERIVQDGGNAFFRRYVGGVATVEYYPSTQATDIKFLLKDHLGSISKVVSTSGVSVLKFSAFGQRATTTWGGVLGTTVTRIYNIGISTQGFTGHEHADGLGIIHMNGRIYDPKLGRFLQADPFVQDPKNSQSLNRYTYVLNNPLSYTDPSGYFSIGKFFKNYWRVIVAAVVTYYTFGAASGWAAAWAAGAGYTASTAAVIGGVVGGATAGFLSGGILTGTLKGAFYGGLTGAALGGIGGSSWNDAVRTLAAGTAGGITTELQGGKFGHGFLSAGVGFWTGLKFGGAPGFGKFLATAIVGGTISEITGGKFGNGAISAGLAYVVAAAAAQSGRKIPDFDLSTSKGREQYANWVWDNKGRFGIEVPAGTSFEYVDEYMMYDNKLGRIICDGPCTQVNDVSRFAISGEYLDTGKVVLYRGSFSPMQTAEILGPGSNTMIIGNLNVSPTGSVVWAMGHEAAHAMGIDMRSAVYPHLEAHGYGYLAYQRYKSFGSE